MLHRQQQTQIEPGLRKSDIAVIFQRILKFSQSMVKHLHNTISIKDDTLQPAMQVVYIFSH